eukprot:gb/GECH01010978.1/.p1 GENE.gb/GECH01010978.1/~~gb/GECH01010978.1/.p1  ORF type:complete len:431 (+),score=86.41 gb/GECH01010978.1/:1-1293(+)
MKLNQTILLLAISLILILSIFVKGQDSKENQNNGNEETKNYEQKSFSRVTHPSPEELSKRINNARRNPIFVFYTSHSCEECFNLLNEWENAAESYMQLADWAVIDCSLHNEFCKQKNITKIPSFVLYNDNGAFHKKRGARTALAFGNYALRTTGPILAQINEEVDFKSVLAETDADKELRNEYSPIKFIYFGELKGDGIKNFHAAALDYRESADFFVTSSEEWGQRYFKLDQFPAVVGISHGTFVSFKGLMRKEEFQKFFQRWQWGIVPQLSGEIFNEFVSRGKPLVILAVAPSLSEFAPLLEHPRSLVTKYQSFLEIGWLNADIQGNYLRQVYGVRVRDTPMAIIVDPLTRRVLKRNITTEFNDQKKWDAFLKEVSSDKALGVPLSKIKPVNEGYLEYLDMAKTWIHEHLYVTLGSSLFFGFLFGKILF